MTDKPEIPPEVKTLAEKSIRAHFDILRDQAIMDLGDWFAQMIAIHAVNLNNAYRGNVFGALLKRRDMFAKGSPEWKAFDDYLEQLGAKTHHGLK